METSTQPLSEDYLADLGELVHGSDSLSVETTETLTKIYWDNVIQPDLEDSTTIETPTASKVYRIYCRDYARAQRYIAPDGMLKSATDEVKAQIKQELAAIETSRIDEDALIVLAVAFLERSEINPAFVQRPAQLEIGRDLRRVAEGQLTIEDGDTEQDLLIEMDEESRSVYTRDGEFVCSLDPPDFDMSETKPMLEWVGERMTQHTASIAGLEAEKAIYLSRITAMFDKRIAKRKRAIKGLQWVYGPMGETYLREALKGSRARSTMVGQLELKFTKERASTKVTDEQKAIAFIEAQLKADEKKKERVWNPDVLKIEKSVMVSKIPTAALNTLPFDAFLYNPGGKDKFEMK
jgi:hypothetical protein